MSSVIFSVFLYISWKINITAASTIITIGAKFLIKSINPNPAAEPIIILGGSPINVAVPPILEEITSGRTKGIGSSSKVSVITNVIGTISKMVVTLSSSADASAVNSEKTTIIFHGSPLTAFAALIAMYSNAPVLLNMLTIIIIPTKSPMVLKSIVSIALSCVTILKSSSIVAPNTAIVVLLIFSEIITPYIIINIAMAVIM